MWRGEHELRAYAPDLGGSNRGVSEEETRWRHSQPWTSEHPTKHGTSKSHPRVSRTNILALHGALKKSHRRHHLQSSTKLAASQTKANKASSLAPITAVTP